MAQRTDVCRNGHPRTADHYVIRPNGRGVCVTCEKANGQKYRDRLTASRPPRLTWQERFWSKVYPCPVTGCWLWGGHLKVARGGYGSFADAKRRIRRAHVVSYELATGGPAPQGLQLDHLCRVTACVNPDHLEAVSPQVNNLRSNSPSAVSYRTDTCKRGHTLLGENGYVVPGTGGRSCRTCRRMLNKGYRDRARLHTS